MKIRLTIQDHDTSASFHRLSGANRRRWPVIFGFPLPEGILGDPAKLALQSDSSFCPAEFVATSRWADGSARWVHGLALIDLEISQTREFTIVVADSPTGDDGGILIEENSAGARLQNEFIQLSVNPEEGKINGLPAIPEFRMLLKDGLEGTARWDAVKLSERRELRGSITLQGGYFSPDGRRLLDAELSWTLTQDQDWIEMTHRVRHRTPGVACFEIHRWSAVTPLPAHNRLHLRQKNHATAWLPRDVSPEGPVELKILPGGARVADLRMVNEYDINSYPPYLRKGQDAVEPWIGWEGETSLLFWAEAANGKSPQCWNASTESLRLDWIVPENPITLNQGQGMSQTWRWQFLGADSTPAIFREHFLRHQQQPFLHHDSDWARQCPGGEWENALLYLPKQHRRIEYLLDSCFQSLPWPSGLMNWGDGVDPNYSQGYRTIGRTDGGEAWTNNEYDVIFSHIHQMYRTGNGKYWPAIQRMVGHALDVDFLDFHDDEWLHHGSPVHSVNHVTASSYPSHIWTEGLLHYYYITHDDRALETARKSGDFLLKYIAERWPVFTLTARESGWPLLALTELFLATREEKYLVGARRIRDALLELALAEEPFFPGEAHFFIGVAILGLEKLHRTEPDSRTFAAIERILDWRLEHRFSPEGMPYDHWNSALSRIGRQHFLCDAFTTGYRHGGKKAYLEQLWVVFQFEIEADLRQPPAPCPKTTATRYRSLYRTLECLRRNGLLEALEFLPLNNFKSN